MATYTLLSYCVPVYNNARYPLLRDRKSILNPLLRYGGNVSHATGKIKSRSILSMEKIL